MPTGGQFAPTAHAESTATLERPGDDGPDAVALFAQADTSARFWSRRYSVSDAEDVRQDVLVAYLSAQRNRAPAGEPNGELVRVGSGPSNREAYLHASARAASARAMQQMATGVPGASRELKALRELGSRRDRLAQQLGRMPSSAELDALAEEVRLSFPPRRRPPVGFHRRARRAAVSVDGDRLDVPEAPSATSRDFEIDSLAASIERSAVDGGRPGLAAARTRAYNALAEAAGAPPAATGSLTEQKAAAARRVVGAAGGPSGALAAWRSAKVDPEVVAALFSPFGSLDDAGRAAVGRVLEAHPAYTDDLWGSAIASATARRRHRNFEGQEVTR